MRFYISTIDENGHKTAKKYGLGIEVAEYCTALNMDEKYKETDAQVREKLQGVENVIIHGPFNELFPCAIDPFAAELCRKRFIQAIKLTQSCGAKKLVLHGGYNPYLYYKPWYVEKSAVFWQDFMAHVPSDVTIVLENVFEEEPDMTADIVRAVSRENFKMCLDIGHVSAYSHVPVDDWLSSCADVIGHFHIHNNDGKKDSHQSLSDGVIDMKSLLFKATELCPDATMTLEVMNAEDSARWLQINGFV